MKIKNKCHVVGEVPLIIDIKPEHEAQTLEFLEETKIVLKATSLVSQGLLSYEEDKSIDRRFYKLEINFAKLIGKEQFCANRTFDHYYWELYED